MGRNLTNLYVSQSFQYLLQKSGSAVTDGLGADVSSLDISSSYATSASRADIATSAVTATSATTATSSSFASSATSASHAAYAMTSSLPLEGFVNVTVGEGNLTFVKGDGNETIVPISVTGSVSSSVSSSYAATADQMKVVNDNTNNTRYVTFVDVTSGRDDLRADTDFSYNPSSNTLSVTNLSGNASTATSASHAVQADNATTADSATTSTYSDNTVVTGKNVSGSPITKGTPLYFTGSGTSGNLVGVWPADASNPARMPAGGIAGEAIAAGAEGVVLLDGFISGVDTSLFNSGDQIWVKVGGGYTNQRPTGSSTLVQPLGYVEKVHPSNGSGVIKGPGIERAMPNITQDYTWVGDSDGVAQPTAVSSLSVASAISSSHAVQADSALAANTATSASHALVSDTVNDANVAYQNQNNVFTGTQSFTNISVSGTGSFGMIQSVTGSAKIIGDAFVQVNTNAPALRYGGIRVVDSGSSAVTASLQWDSENDYWMQVEADGTSAGLITGLSGSLGSEAFPTKNTIVKGGGEHTITDSSITDDGSTVTIGANTEITGSLVVSASNNLWVTSWPGSFQTKKITDFGNVTGGDSVVYDDNHESIYNYLGAGAHLNGWLRTYTGDSANYFSSFWHGPNAAYWLLQPSGSGTENTISLRNDSGAAVTARVDANTVNIGNTIAGNITVGNSTSTTIISGSVNVAETINGTITNATSASYAANAGWDGSYVSTGTIGSLTVSGSGANNLWETDWPGSFQTKKFVDFGTITGLNGITYDDNFESIYNYLGVGPHLNGVLRTFTGGGQSYFNSFWQGPNSSYWLMTVSGSLTEHTIALRNDTGDQVDARVDADDIKIGNAIAGNLLIGRTGANTVISGALDVHETITGTITNATSASYALTASYAPWDGSFTGDATIDGSLTITGSIANQVTTVSQSADTYYKMNLDSGSYFDLALVSGSNVFVQGLNVKPGQTFVLRTTQPSSSADSYGTIQFDGNFAFSGGTAPTATAATGSVDIYTFVVFEETTIYSTQVTDLK